jgi:hypothetical protein
MSISGLMSILVELGGPGLMIILLLLTGLMSILVGLGGGVMTIPSSGMTRRLRA